jgi:glutamate/tyrosine decarboxylase-like PLP-dependent enzyme
MSDIDPIKKKCDPRDIAFKALFLGAQAENGSWFQKKWQDILARWIEWRKDLFPEDGLVISKDDQRVSQFQKSQSEIDVYVDRLFHLLEGETPKFTPRYLGHMVSETSMPALLGHVTALLHNANNTSRESSKIGIELETEAICDLLKMVGFDFKQGQGHFTSGGTLANLESMWRALFRLDRNMALGLYLMERGAFSPNKSVYSWSLGWSELEKMWPQSDGRAVDLSGYSLLEQGPWKFQEIFLRVTGRSFQTPLIVAPANRHFSWPKIISMLGLGASSLVEVPLDSGGRMSITDFREIISSAISNGQPLLGAVSVLGTTELGAVDPVDQIQDFLDDLKNRLGVDIWHHVDAAYGGYFATMSQGSDQGLSLGLSTSKAISALGRVHSITIDPHKLGYVPYACGAILTKDLHHYQVKSFSAPYLMGYKANRWAYTIEGSRAATGAAATWMANRTLPLNADGYGRILEKGIRGRNRLLQLLEVLKEEVIIVPSHDLNLVCFSLGRKGEKLSIVNHRTLRVFEKFVASPTFSVSKTTMKRSSYTKLIDKILIDHQIQADDDKLVCLRAVLMNPFTTSKESRVDFLSKFTEELMSHNNRTFLEVESEEDASNE